MIVETSLGKFKLGRPTLGGYRRILGALPKENYDVIVDIILKVQSADSEQRATSMLLETGRGALAGLASRAPTVLAALARECLYDPDSTSKTLALSVERAEMLDDDDAEKVLAALKEIGLWRDLAKRLKKHLGGLLVEKAVPT